MYVFARLWSQEGYHNIERLLRVAYKSAGRFGTIVPTIKSISMSGYVAYVHTLESVGPVHTSTPRRNLGRHRQHQGWFPNNRVEDQQVKQVCVLILHVDILCLFYLLCVFKVCV
jgi:hypothetical protein